MFLVIATLFWPPCLKYGFLGFETILSMFEVILYLVSFDLIKWKFYFVGMNVVMGWKTIMKTPTT
jgi:hypothetical protein